jgi:hypothetical protein
MLDVEELRNFLIKAKKKGYAAGSDVKAASDVMVTKDENGTTIYFSQGDWRYEDNYCGGEPFGGTERVFYKGKQVWRMSYHGRVLDPSDKEVVYPFLKRMLSFIMPEKPFRGPGLYLVGDMHYNNTSVGDIEDFFGNEKILIYGREIYRAVYIGGVVDI